MRGRIAIAAGLALAVVAVAAAGVGLRPAAMPASMMPAIVHLAAGPQSYRPAGEFRIGTRVVDGPLQQLAGQALDVMTYHVSQADYARCVAAQACPSVASQRSATQAQTGVNYGDAVAYARWFSGITGQDWRLPTDAEWLRLAGDRAVDDGLDPGANGSDPAQRWLASYRRDVAIRGEADFIAHPLGHFGRNDLGVADVAGNIWEWTATCYQNGRLSPDGQRILTVTEHCGVQAVQGKHRAFVIDFVRDARSGGCSAGVPPDYLGFRLVRDAE